eukprot:619711_1
MMTGCNKLTKRINRLISNDLESPEDFCAENPSRSLSCLKTAKALFREGVLSTKRHTLPGSAGGPLSKLRLSGFDGEQVFEQVRLQSRPLFGFLADEFLNVFESLTVPETEESPEDDQSDDSSEGESSSSDSDQSDSQTEKLSEMADEQSSSDEDTSEISETRSGDGEQKDVEMDINPTSPGIDSKSPESDEEGGVTRDRFFSMTEMEKFTEQLDDLGGQDEEENDENEDALYVTGESGNFKSGPTYSDFFGAQEEEAKVESANDGPPSAFGNRQEALANQISSLQEKIVAPRNWDLMGEASVKERPKDSLLETYLDFEHTAGLKPVITEEFTQTLEDIIRERILAECWDDVERKAEPKEKPFVREVKLDQEKSEVGLADIYAKQFVEQVTGAPSDEQTEMDEEHSEIAAPLLPAGRPVQRALHTAPAPPRDEGDRARSSRASDGGEAADRSVGCAGPGSRRGLQKRRRARWRR